MRLEEAFSKFMPASLASPREALVAWGKSVRSHFNLGVIVCVCEYRISESTCMYLYKHIRRYLCTFVLTHKHSDTQSYTHLRVDNLALTAKAQHPAQDQLAHAVTQGMLCVCACVRVYICI